MSANCKHESLVGTNTHIRTKSRLIYNSKHDFVNKLRSSRLMRRPTSGRAAFVVYLTCIVIMLFFGISCVTFLGGRKFQSAILGQHVVGRVMFFYVGGAVLIRYIAGKF